MGRFHTVHSATTKGSLRGLKPAPTSAQGAQAQPLDVAHAIGSHWRPGPNRWTAMEGGFPIIAGGECIGGDRRERPAIGKPTPASHAPPWRRSAPARRPDPYARYRRARNL